jgi:hypothetical protein
MSERIRSVELAARAANVNRRFEDLGSPVRYATQGRNGSTGLDRYNARSGMLIDTVSCGTKRE